jgi:hypothetical protein
VHLLALDLLRRLNFPTAGVRSKGWEEFSGPSAPSMDFVFTVCDRPSAPGASSPSRPGSTPKPTPGPSPHFEAALKAFQAAGRTLKDLFKFLVHNFGEGSRSTRSSMQGKGIGT